MSRRLAGTIGLSLIALLVVISLAAPALERAFGCPLGADVELPRHSVCERTAGGLRTSLTVGVLAGGGGVALALALALTARAARGPIERGLDATAMLVFAIPDVLILILVGFAARQLELARGWSPDPFSLMTLSLILVGWAAPFQMLRRRLESIEGEEFVAAAAAIGASRPRRLLRHVLPHATGLVVATLCMRVPLAMLAESAASFLGFGLPPTDPSLGSYFGQNYRRLLTGEWRILVPTWALFVLTTLAFRLAAGLFERER